MSTCVSSANAIYIKELVLLGEERKLMIDEQRLISLTTHILSLRRPGPKEKNGNSLLSKIVVPRKLSLELNVDESFINELLVSPKSPPGQFSPISPFVRKFKKQTRLGQITGA